MTGRRVNILPGYEPWFAAFCELSSERRSGMGPGPIPHSAILAYAQWMGWEAEFDAFLACIRAMDAAYLEWANTDPEKRKTIAKEPLSPAVLAGMFGKGST